MENSPRRSQWPHAGTSFPEGIPAPAQAAAAPGAPRDEHREKHQDELPLTALTLQPAGAARPPQACCVCTALLPRTHRAKVLLSLETLGSTMHLVTGEMLKQFLQASHRRGTAEAPASSRHLLHDAQLVLTRTQPAQLQGLRFLSDQSNKPARSWLL